MNITATFEANAQIVEGSKPNARSITQRCHGSSQSSRCHGERLMRQCHACEGGTTPCNVIPLVGTTLFGMFLQSVGHVRHRQYCIARFLEDHRVLPIGTGHGQPRGDAAADYDETTSTAKCRGPWNSSRTATAGGTGPENRSTHINNICLRANQLKSIASRI